MVGQTNFSMCWTISSVPEKWLTNGERPVVQLRAQFSAFEQFHDDVRCAVLRADIVNGQDVRMVERASGAGFALKAANALGVRGVLRRQKLQRDLALESRITRQINLAHPADAQN